jgi:hypothetical protein
MFLRRNICVRFDTKIQAWVGITLAKLTNPGFLVPNRHNWSPNRVVIFRFCGARAQEGAFAGEVKVDKFAFGDS